MKRRSYDRADRRLRPLLRPFISKDVARRLHERSGLAHAIVAIRHVLLFSLVVFLLLRFENPIAWLPLAALQGCQILGFIILLHEVVHRVVSERHRPTALRLLGFLYAFPSGISATQFERWHLDHHRELGSWTDDPKRAWLTPKIVARWYKLLYLTPALFVIYARAAGREASTYDAATRSRIRRERVINVVLHLAIAVTIVQVWDGAALFRAWLAPLFLFFPPAFVINRLGQHYDIDPQRPAAWSTRIDGNPIVRFLFLNSNHHIEHHYYPGVPMHHLPELNRRLRPFFEKERIVDRGYLGLMWDWYVANRSPHSDWSKAEATSPGVEKSATPSS